MTTSALATEIDAVEIRRLRDLRGYKSDRAMALAADISPPHLGRVLRGEADPGLHLLHKLSRALGARVSDIIIDDDGPPTLIDEKDS